MYWQHNESIVSLHLALGWVCITLGIISGALMGLFFHSESWLGGYATVARRLIRLGHISFFGMAFLNFSLSLTLFIMDTLGLYSVAGSLGLIIATVSMPLICFLSVIKGINRAIFTIPVGGTIVLILAVFTMLLQSRISW